MDKIFNAGNMVEQKKRYVEMGRRENITTQNKELLKAKTLITARWENNISKTQSWLEAIEKNEEFLDKLLEKGRKF